MVRIKKVLVIAAIGTSFAANGQTAGNDFVSARTQKVDMPTNFCVENNSQPIKWNGQLEKWDMKKGNGTKEFPILIEKPEHLAFLANEVKYGEGAVDNVVFKDVYFKLMVNFDLNGIPWTPIGYRIRDSWHHFFGGHFDGNGHTISGLFVNCKDEWLGLFGGIKDGSVSCLKVSGRIERIDPPIPAPIPDLPPPPPTFCEPYGGGIVAFSVNTTIQNCYSECNILFKNTDPTFLGGITGGIEGGSISFCANRGNITTISTGDTTLLGGIAGYAKNATISNSYNTGDIESVSDELSDICCRGGIVGDGNGADIIDCYNMGNVGGDCDARRFSGGIVAVALDIIIKNCYNTGSISDTKGGVIIGKQFSNANVSNCYYLNVSGENNSLGGTSKTENFMKTTEMVELLGSAFGQDVMPYFNQGYPILLNNALTTGITESTSSFSNKVTIYPNPTATQLYVNRINQETADYTIYNIMGQVILQGKLQGESSTINIEYLAKGMHYIKFAGKTLKFVKE